MFIFLAWAGKQCLCSSWGQKNVLDLKCVFFTSLLFHVAVLKQKAKRIFSVVSCQAHDQVLAPMFQQRANSKKSRAL